MRVLILGASGFIGSWAARALVARGVSAIALVRPRSDQWRIADIGGLEIVAEEEADWARAVQLLKPDVIVSLDWAGVGGSERNLNSQWDNLSRQRSVLDAAAESGVRRFVGVGSQAEYGPKASTITETMTAQPVTEYGKAKLAAMLASREACDNTGIEWVWARVFSTFGPLDNSNWLLPSVAEALLSERDISLTSGEQAWSYLYGADAGVAMAVLATSLDAEGIFNVGNPIAPPLRRSIEEFAGHFASGGRLNFGAIPFGEHAVMRLEPDTTRLESLGWTAATTYADGLRTTAQWASGSDIPDPFQPGAMLPVGIR